MDGPRKEKKKSTMSVTSPTIESLERKNLLATTAAGESVFTLSSRCSGSGSCCAS